MDLTYFTQLATAPQEDQIPVFKNHYNSRSFPKAYEKNLRPSVTIPDQSMSIKTIMERYARGLPATDVKTPIYHGEDEFFPDLSKMDLADRQTFIEEKQDELKELNERLRKPKEKPEYKDQELPFQDLPNQKPQSDPPPSQDPQKINP